MPPEDTCAVCGASDGLQEWGLAPKSKTARQVILCATCGEPLTTAFRAVRRRSRGLPVTSMDEIKRLKDAAQPSAHAP